MNTKQGKQPVGLAVVNQQDVHALLPRLMLQAEKSPDSLERMLAVTRLYFTFLTQLMKPGSKYGDVPTVVLGEHYLSHRNIHGELHRGDNTRSYLQEICAYDPVEAPIPTAYETDTAGHVDVGMLSVNMVPSASVKSARVEGSASVYVEVSFGGEDSHQGASGGVRRNSVYYTRHDEEYVFTVPSLLLTNISKHSASRCRLDFEGNCSITCQVRNVVLTRIASYRTVGRRSLTVIGGRRPRMPRRRPDWRRTFASSRSGTSTSREKSRPSWETAPSPWHDWKATGTTRCPSKALPATPPASYSVPATTPRGSPSRPQSTSLSRAPASCEGCGRRSWRP